MLATEGARAAVLRPRPDALEAEQMRGARVRVWPCHILGRLHETDGAARGLGAHWCCLSAQVILCGSVIILLSDHGLRRHDNTLHIINSDTDLGQGIAHVITLEMLRK